MTTWKMGLIFSGYLRNQKRKKLYFASPIRSAVVNGKNFLQVVSKKCNIAEPDMYISVMEKTADETWPKVTKSGDFALSKGT